MLIINWPLNWSGSNGETQKVVCKNVILMELQAIKASMSDFRKEDWLTNVPLYAISEIQKLVNPELGG